jgi:mRNA interferase RelE/StbE/toxin YoeB
MYRIEIEDCLKQILQKLFKKNRKVYEIIMRKIEEIIQNPYHYKPLRYDMKTLRRVHIEKSFVLIFKIDEDGKTVRFLDFDHHDNIYKR